MIAVAGAALLLAACGNVAQTIAEKTVEAQTGGDVSISDDGKTINVESKDGSGSIKFSDNGDNGASISGTDEKGNEFSVNMGGSEVPDDFPMPIFDPSEVTNVSTSESSAGKSFAITLKIDPGDADAAIAFYNDWLTGQGMDVQASDGIVIGTSDQSFSMVATADYGDYSELIISWSPGG